MSKIGAMGYTVEDTHLIRGFHGCRWCSALEDVKNRAI